MQIRGKDIETIILQLLHPGVLLDDLLLGEPALQLAQLFRVCPIPKPLDFRFPNSGFLGLHPDRGSNLFEDTRLLREGALDNCMSRFYLLQESRRNPHAP